MEIKKFLHHDKKMKQMMLTIIMSIFIFACQEATNTNEKPALEQEQFIIHKEKNSLIERFPAPKNATLYEANKNTFEFFLQHLPLKEDGKDVQLFNGALKNNQDAHAAILDIEVGNKDLQQCADAVMRLRSEYFFKEKAYEKINFHFTNGFEANFNKWKNGERISVKGNSCSWIKTKNSISESRTTFNAFLEMLFSYAGTASLEKYDLKNKTIKDIKPGDVFIIGGHPGHAVIVLNTAFDKINNETYFMLAQSYMPAQEIHVLKNPNNKNLSPWYKLSDIEDYLYTPEYTFKKENLKEFKE